MDIDLSSQVKMAERTHCALARSLSLSLPLSLSLSLSADVQGRLHIYSKLPDSAAACRGFPVL